MGRWIQVCIAVMVLNISIAVADGFVQYTVTTGFLAPAGLSVCSMNDDEHLDILGAAWNDDEISYWINSGEIVPKWEEFVVTDSLDGASFACAGHVNSDGYVDIAAGGWYANTILCFLGDGGNSWTPFVVSDNFANPHEVHFVDVDQDEMIDLLAAGGGSAAVSWWRNDGSSPDQWQRYDVCTTMPGGRSVCWADFDLDGDLDLAGCALTCDDVRWWENDGESIPGWTEHLVADSFDGAHMIRTADINGDGFCDLASVACLSGEIAIWLNTGGSSVEWEKHKITGSFGVAMGVELADLNNDDQVDMICTSMVPSQIALWTNNGGSPSTWTKEIIDGTLSGAWPLSSGDLNGDGYADLAGGANAADFIRWYRNDIISGIEEGHSVNTGFFLGEARPNPAHGSVSLLLYRNESGNSRVSVMDIAGRTVCELFEGPSPAGESDFLWNGCTKKGSPVSAGIYYIVADSDSGENSTCRITILR